MPTRKTTLRVKEVLRPDGRWAWYVVHRGRRIAVTVTEAPDEEDIVCWIPAWPWPPSPNRQTGSSR